MHLSDLEIRLAIADSVIGPCSEKLPRASNVVVRGSIIAVRLITLLTHQTKFTFLSDSHAYR